MKNGYIITYWVGLQWVDQDHILGKQDAEDCINAAIHVGMCDLITLHCIDRGDVLYTEELFHIGDKWYRSIHNAVMGTHTMSVM